MMLVFSWLSSLKTEESMMIYTQCHTPVPRGQGTLTVEGDKQWLDTFSGIDAGGTDLRRAYRKGEKQHFTATIPSYYHSSSFRG